MGRYYQLFIMSLDFQIFIKNFKSIKMPRRRFLTQEDAMRAQQQRNRNNYRNRQQRANRAARNPPVHQRRNDQATNPEQVAKKIKLDDFSLAVSFNFLLLLF